MLALVYALRPLNYLHGQTPVKAFVARPRLAWLDISPNHFRRGGLEPLLSAGCPAGLERLELADCRLTGPDGPLLTTARWQPTGVLKGATRFHERCAERAMAEGVLREGDEENEPPAEELARK